MKKLIALILVLCMAAALVPAFAEDDITGVWYLNRAVANGIHMNVISDEVRMTVTIREDGTAEVFSALPGEEPQDAEATWTYADGLVTITDKAIDGETTILKCENGELSLEAAGAMMILTRETYTPYELPAVLKAESVEAFYGTWYPEISFQSGLMAFLGDALEVELRSKLVVSAEGMTETANDGTVTTYVNPAVDPETGVLSATFDVQGYEATIRLALLEDGTLLVTGSVYDTELMRSIYYRLAE